MSSSKFTCSPSKPTKQIALRVPLVGKNGFSFRANIQINPNKFNSLKITAVPDSGEITTKAPPPPTTTEARVVTTTTTTTTETTTSTKTTISTTTSSTTSTSTTTTTTT